MLRHSSNFTIRTAPSSHQSVHTKLFLLNRFCFLFSFLNSFSKWLSSSHQTLCLRRTEALCWQSVQAFEGSQFPGYIRSPCYMALRFLPSASLLKMGVWRGSPGALWAVPHKCKYTRIQCTLASAHVDPLTHTGDTKPGEGTYTHTQWGKLILDAHALWCPTLSYCPDSDQKNMITVVGRVYCLIYAGNRQQQL